MTMKTARQTEVERRKGAALQDADDRVDVCLKSEILVREWLRWRYTAVLGPVYSSTSFPTPCQTCWAYSWLHHLYFSGAVMGGKDPDRQADFRIAPCMRMNALPHMWSSQYVSDRPSITELLLNVRSMNSSIFEQVYVISDQLVHLLCDWSTYASWLCK